MTLAATTTSNSQRLDLASGVTIGHVLTRHHGLTVAGPRPGHPEAATLRADGHFATLFQAPYPPQTSDGLPVDRLTLRDLTLDAADVATLTTVVGGTMAAGPLAITLENVAIRNVHRNTIAVISTSELSAQTLAIFGNGGGIKTVLASTRTHLRGVTVRGGLFAYDVSDIAAPADIGTVAGIDIDGLDGDMYLTQSPRFEAVTATAIDALGIDATHVTADRSLYDTIRILVPVCTYDPQRSLRNGLVRVGDRIETASRDWTRVTGLDGAAQVEGWHAAGSMHAIDTPSDEATVYRPTFGRVFGWSAGRVNLKTDGGLPAFSTWRTADGTAVATPTLAAGVIVDLIRHGISATASVRDYDTGAIHVTRSALDARIRNVSTRDTGSDGQSYRGVGTVVERCFHALSRDMCFTVDGVVGPQIIRDCQASGAGVHGFYLGGGPSQLLNFTASGCGSHGSGYGAYVESDSLASVLQGSGSGNLDGLAPDGIVVLPRDRPARVQASRRRRGRW